MLQLSLIPEEIGYTFNKFGLHNSSEKGILDQIVAKANTDYDILLSNETIKSDAYKHLKPAFIDGDLSARKFLHITGLEVDDADAIRMAGDAAHLYLMLASSNE